MDDFFCLGDIHFLDIFEGDFVFWVFGDVFGPGLEGSFLFGFFGKESKSSQIMIHLVLFGLMLHDKLVFPQK